jgi:hypothetical protein
MKINEWTPAHSAAQTELEQLCEELQAKYPAAGLSFGYIGNLDYRFDNDDRGWHFFTRLPCRDKKDFCQNALSWPGYSVPTAELPKFVERARMSLERWIKIQLNLTAENVSHS